MECHWRKMTMDQISNCVFTLGLFVFSVGISFGVDIV